MAEHVHTTIFKLENQQGPIPYSTWDSAQRYVAAWMGGEFGGEWRRVYVRLSPFAVHLQLSYLANYLAFLKFVNRYRKEEPGRLQSMGSQSQTRPNV